MKKLMIVESPNKVKTIQAQAILGRDWEIAASAGHIRDLPRQEMGVDTRTFEMKYEYVPGQSRGGRTFPGGKERVARLARKVKQADMVYLATDPDREGEAIAWHLKEALRLKPGQYRRVTFDAIDHATIEQALASPRDIDMERVHAQEARRALDRLVGYTVSPLISNALHERLSAGRVQSPALRYVVDREREIRNFRVTNHFGAELLFDNKAWRAEWQTRPFLKDGERYILDRGIAEAAAAVREVEVVDAKAGTKAENPPPPFSTSTLIQAASVALKFSPEKAAKISQTLFENGHITYHRTDSLNLADQAVAELRGYAQQQGLPLPDKPRRFKSKADAQEAHEAIRPKHFEKRGIDGSDDEQALYRLIWERAVACQLAPAKYKASILMLAGQHQGQTFHYRASGRVLIEPGWRTLTRKAAEHDEELAGKDRAEDAESGKVPRLEKGTRISAEDGRVLEKKTRPPKRYTKASLVKELDDGGVGRPSTYPAIMANIERRGVCRGTQAIPPPYGNGGKADRRAGGQRVLFREPRVHQGHGIRTRPDRRRPDAIPCGGLGSFRAARPGGRTARRDAGRHAGPGRWCAAHRRERRALPLPRVRRAHASDRDQEGRTQGTVLLGLLRLPERLQGDHGRRQRQAGTFRRRQARGVLPGRQWLIGERICMGRPCGAGVETIRRRPVRPY